MSQSKSDKKLNRIRILASIHRRPINEIESELANASMELAIVRDTEQNDPARPYIGLIQKTGANKNEIMHLTFKQWRDLYHKSDHAQPLPNTLTKDGKHVAWEYVLDDKAKTLGYKSDEEFRDAIIEAKKRIERRENLERDVTGLANELKRRQDETPSYEFEKERTEAISKGATPEQIEEFDNVIKELKINERYSELQEINNTRSEQAKALDDSILHTKVLSPEDKRTVKWSYEPGSYDVKDIDTPSGEKVKITVKEEPLRLGKSGKLATSRVKRYSGRGKDLGGGVVRDRHGQHIRM